MKALLSREPGGPETLRLEEVPDPVPGSGEVLIAVHACSINYPDVLLIQDLYQARPPRPFAPGSEVGGIVEAVGAGVSHVKPGDRVAASMMYGGLAEKVVVGGDRTCLLPDSMDFVTASAFLVTYGTTIHALKDRAGIKPGETLLVLGAAGGTGISAVELGKAYGARVVAAVSSEEKAALAREAGADEVVIYPHGPLDRAQSKQLANAFKVACGPDGADIVYDSVGGDYSEPAVRACAWGGRFLVIGFPAGIARIPLNLLLLKACDVRGVFYGAFAERDPGRIREYFEELFALHAAGRVSPRVSRQFPLERGGEALALLADRKALGKVVVRIAD